MLYSAPRVKPAKLRASRFFFTDFASGVLDIRPLSLLSRIRVLFS